MKLNSSRQVNSYVPLQAYAPTAYHVSPPYVATRVGSLGFGEERRGVGKGGAGGVVEVQRSATGCTLWEAKPLTFKEHGGASLS